MNEIVKYDNYMNSLKFTGFTTTDFNFLIALCSRMRDKGTNKITFSFAELRNITNYKKSNSIKQFVSDLEHMNEKLMKVTCKLITETEIIMFVLFPTFTINLNKQELTIAVNEHFKFILNELIKNFTRFELKDFISLQSKYSKTLFRLLKQFKTTGILDISLNDFVIKMDIPTSYRIKDITNKIINPSLKELQNYFMNLQCTIKYEQKRGKPVTGYIFTFKPEEIPKTVPEEVPVPVSKSANQRNKLSPEEKDKLVKEFGKGIVEFYVQRAMGYDHCYNYNTVRRWILQGDERDYEERKSKNQFFQFHQREVTSEELDELERKLLRIGLQKADEIEKEEVAHELEQEVLENKKFKDTEEIEETDKELDELERKLLANNYKL